MSQVSHAARRWRLPALLAAAVVAAGVVVALLQPGPADGYLDPDGTGPTGSHALADLLTARGQRVLRVSAPPSAAPPSTGAAGSVELITGAGSLTADQLAQAGRFGGDILLVASTGVDNSTLHAGDDVPDALRAIAPAVQFAGYEPETIARPGCTAQSAVVAGDALFYGALLRTSAPGAQSCYPGTRRDSGYFLASYRNGSRTITVLGSGTPLTNGYLASHGDAALCLNLLRPDRQVIWVVPAPMAQPAGGSGQRSFFSLVPWGVYVIAIQLCVAALLAAAWRARRLGPLVAERLPVTVRASETVEGHGRLYQARRARDRAAGELRAATSARIARLAGGPAVGGPVLGGPVLGGPVLGGTVTVEAIATRAGLTPAEVATLLHGPPPPSDQALVTLAAELDTLERKLRQT
jgi:hypothetical protein